jgi:tripartite-type tricarboxylate transporter receptor subunit TctC
MPYLFWGGIAHRAKTPRPIIDKLYAEIQKVLAVPAAGRLKSRRGGAADVDE